MSRAPTKVLIAGMILACAAGYLIATGVRAGTVYFVDVDRFVDSDALPGARARLHGWVGQELDVRPTDLVATFDLTGSTRRVPVVFRGAIPEQLRPGCQVVVEGVLDERGVFHADTLLTKCASKYEERSGTRASVREEAP